MSNQLLRARIDEAKRALENIAHHLNCPGLYGTKAAPGEPLSCWQGEEGEPCCMRILQWARIRNLENKLRKKAKP